MSAFPSRLRILGIDPGSRVTGFGVIEIEGARSRWIAHGQISCEAGPLPQRLLRIQQEIAGVIAAHAPQEAAVEQVFVKTNVASALVLGQARGAAICALAAAGLVLAEYAPARIKSAVVGSGRAEKAQVQHMMKVLLNLAEAPPADAADALAVALCHAHSRATSAQLGGALKAPRRAPRTSWRDYDPVAALVAKGGKA